MGATVERVRPVSITHKDHFVNVARRRALEARAADSASESQLYALAEQDPQLERRLDQQVKNCATAAHDAASKLPSEEPLASGASRSADEEFTNSLEKEIVACVIAGVNEDSDRKLNGLHVMSEGQVDAGMGSAEVQSRDNELSSSDQGRGGGYFADQFENLANFRAHFEGTGPEIWKQSGGKLDAFIAAAGTGGTIAGVSRYLKVIFHFNNLQDYFDTNCFDEESRYCSDAVFY